MWFELTTLVVIGTDCTDICKSNYYTTTKVNTVTLTHYLSNLLMHVIPESVVHTKLDIYVFFINVKSKRFGNVVLYCSSIDIRTEV
jgi:hypothetical protein